MSGTETERKFLVADDSYRRMAKSSSRIRQGYICAESGRTVRVRRRDERAYLTIKGPSADGGLSRYEFEHEITLDEASHLFDLCSGAEIDKTRYLVDFGGHTFEVDEFHGRLAPLVIAEIELADAAEPFARPPFLGAEVTGDRRYYNSVLSALRAPQVDKLTS